MLNGAIATTTFADRAPRHVLDFQHGYSQYHRFCHSDRCLLPGRLGTAAQDILIESRLEGGRDESDRKGTANAGEEFAA